MNTTTYIRYSEPTVRSNTSQAYSQCLPEPNYEYSPDPQYGPYDNDYIQMSQQPMPLQAPVSKSSSASKSLLFVAGLAVIGAAAFGGVLLLNSDDPQTTRTTSAGAASATDPAGSAVVNLPSAVDIPVLAAPPQSAPAPVIVNNTAPVRASGPTVSKPIISQAPKLASAPAPKPAPAPAPAPAAAPAPAPAPAPKPASGTGGVIVKAPGVEVGVPSQGGVSVKTPGVEVGVPGQGGTGGVVVAVPGSQAPAEKPADKPAEKPAEKPADKPAPQIADVAEGVVDGVGPAGEAVAGAAN